jgi:hypothetical protein
VTRCRSSVSFATETPLQEFKSWRACRVESADTGTGDGAIKSSPLPNSLRADIFKELTAIFRAHLEFRYRQTRPGLKSNEDLSKSRFEQYAIALAHLDVTIGDRKIDPVGEFRIGERQLAEILQRYRQVCKDEMSENEFSGHWFRGYMLVALNCGFKQTERREQAHTSDSGDSFTSTLVVIAVKACVTRTIEAIRSPLSLARRIQLGASHIETACLPPQSLPNRKPPFKLAQATL